MRIGLVVGENPCELKLVEIPAIGVYAAKASSIPGLRDVRFAHVTSPWAGLVTSLRDWNMIEMTQCALGAFGGGTRSVFRR